MGTGISEDNVEGIELVEQLYGLFSGEEFLDDLEAEHRQEILRDEQLSGLLTNLVDSSHHKFNAMRIVIQEHQLEFVQIPLQFQKHGGIVDLFAKKNNKTLAETLLSRRYLSLSTEVHRFYQNSLNDKLGEFLYRLKASGDKFYLRFLNESGDNVFCDFSIASTVLSQSKGIYCFTLGEVIKYIGRSHDPFEKRVNQGYGHISPKNCYRDGQSTNCHVNSLIAKNSAEISFFACPIDDDFKIDRLEKLLIDSYSPEWNVLHRRKAQT